MATGSIGRARFPKNGFLLSEDKSRLINGDAFAVNIEYSLNDGQTKYQMFTTPNTSTRVHLSIKCYSAGRTQITFWENPTTPVVNFGWTPRDRNRETANTAASTVEDLTSVTAPGTFLIKESCYGSGLATNQSHIMEFPELFLDQDTEYLIGMTSYEASNLTTVQLKWYEVD